MAGQEGLEPPTTGFGDRCSAKLSYWPRILIPKKQLLDLPVLRPFPLKPTVLLHLYTVRRKLLVPRRRIIATLTLSTGQCYKLPRHLTSNLTIQ